MVDAAAADIPTVDMDTAADMVEGTAVDMAITDAATRVTSLRTDTAADTEVGCLP